ncbi:hypothetical protein E3N88_42332 [Mikania micrantha]|uniref:Uncharacterized protein n=1 Tax=Mikania micrantha TaxID=192012 RepID=A0A5N6LKA9_9ASTR|nr:hypothetical protein E3N88_42332 [Mikania micrantha]
MDLSVMIQPQTHHIPYHSSSNDIVCIHRPPPPLQETRSPQPTSIKGSIGIKGVDYEIDGGDGGDMKEEGEEEEIQRLAFGGVHGRMIKVGKEV